MKQLRIDNDVDAFVKRKFDKLHSWAKLPIFLGIVTSLIYICIYGFMDYLKNFLQWIIGATMVIIVVEYFTRNGKNNTDKQ